MVVRPDQVSLGVLVSAVPRDSVDGEVAACRVGDRRSGGKLSAHVTAYLAMAMCLFADEDYEEVVTKVTGSRSAWGCWDAGWSVPTASGIIQARKRLEPKVLAEVVAQVAGPVADTTLAHPPSTCVRSRPEQHDQLTLRGIALGPGRRKWEIAHVSTRQTGTGADPRETQPPTPMGRVTRLVNR
jgi:hypothetical protein